ncbi:erythromycin resistance leader peptide [Metabacillus dongyingensis]|nr:erythromycin resistance leader peptide [Bacillus sp. DNRA2]
MTHSMRLRFPSLNQ